MDELVAGMLRTDPAERLTMDEVVAALSDMWRAPMITPLAGMTTTRLALHSAIALARTKPVVVVLVGPPCSGVNRLLSEALSVATRNGFSSTGGEDRVRVATWPTPGLSGRIRAALAQDKPCLWLIGSQRAIEELDEPAVQHIMIDPLSFEASAPSFEGLAAADMTRAWREIGGHPGRLGVEPCDPRSPANLRVLGMLERQYGHMTVGGLAKALAVHPMALLDQLELLESVGAVTFGSGGQTIRIADTWIR
jgi:hypothetical protein